MEQLRLHRQKKNLTLAYVADKAGISVPYLSEIERGNRYGSAQVLRKICQALGIKAAPVLEEAAKKRGFL